MAFLKQVLTSVNNYVKGTDLDRIPIVPVRKIRVFLAGLLLLTEAEVAASKL